MTSQNAKGPAEAATSPDRGSITHPCMRKEEMNEATNSTAPAVEQELICDKVERLARELAEALPLWANGAFMAEVFPAGDPRGFWFRNTRTTARGKEIDPVITALQAYQNGNAAFCAIKENDWPELGGQEAVINMTYGPPMEVLNNWELPCTSKDGAIAALKFALQEIDDFYGEPRVVCMMTAALAYLEGAAA
ncbi:hypothetical protein D3C87_1160910 [compost metagenome]